MAIRFFHSASYSTHPYPQDTGVIEDQPVGVRAYVEKDRGIAFTPDFDIKSIFKVRQDLARSVKFYGARLANVDPVSFNYLTEPQRIALEEELLFTFYNLSAAYQLSLFEGDNHRVKKRVGQLQRCANLLNTLRNTPRLDEKKSPEQAHQERIDDSEKPAAYITLTIIAPVIAETMLSFSAAERLRLLKKIMSDANFYRLNWVWGGGLDCILLDLMPSGVGRSQQAMQVFADVSPVTGYMSWVLYYLRLGIELYLLTKYTFKGSWMDPWATEADKAISREIGLCARFQTQWELRKFSLLNDALWATANMACFFWLIGSGGLGYAGNVVTGLLLIVDLTLVAWGYQEKKAEHMKALLQYDMEIALLVGGPENPGKIDLETNAVKKKVLIAHLDVLIEAKKKCEFDWEYAEKQWQQDMWYALGLFAAFSMLCCFFIPPVGLLPAIALILGVIGAALSFLMTIASHAWATSTEIEKLKAACDEHEKNLNQLKENLALLKENKQSIKLELNIKRLELDIKHRQDDLDYQKAMIAFRKQEIIQQSLSEALVPAVAFAILVFMPLGTGLFILIPSIVLLMLSGRLLGLTEPEPPASPDDVLPAVSP